MSPLSIPGTSIHIPYPPGKSKCRKCKRDFDQPKPKRNGNKVTLHCPYCKHVVKSYSAKALKAKNKKKKKGT